MLSACHSQKETCAKAEYVQEVARSDVTISDIDTYLSKLVNRNIVISMEDVVVQYQGEDSSTMTGNIHPTIRSPSGATKLSIAHLTISEISEEATAVYVEDNSIQTIDSISNETANFEQQVTQKSEQFHTSHSILFMSTFCFSAVLFVVILVILYRKGKLRL